jgi:hypothetical protein
MPFNYSVPARIIAFQMSAKASGGIQGFNELEKKEMDRIINLMTKNHQDSQALVAKQRKEDDSRFVRRIDEVIWHFLRL